VSKGKRDAEKARWWKGTTSYPPLAGASWLLCPSDALFLIGTVRWGRGRLPYPPLEISIASPWHSAFSNDMAYYNGQPTGFVG
jgi:hypothetical protein